MINGDIETIEINGDVSNSSEISGNIENEIELDATVNPITPVGNDYTMLINKPQINSVELVENKTLDELNIQVKGDYPDQSLTNQEIEDLLNNFA